MKIILNSDVMFTSKLIRARLPSRLHDLATECARTGVVIAIPRTTLLEVERRQKELVTEAISELERAYNALKEAEISFEEKNSSEVFSVPDVVELFKHLGVKVEIVEPTLEDYHDAHLRACLHLNPQPPGRKSDEMRDLLIWVMALRLAKDGGGILLSRDEVHTHDRGNEEADTAGLLRANDIGEGLELLGVESPSGKLVRILLDPIWQDLRNAELPLPPTIGLRKVENATFVRGERGIESAKFDLHLGSLSGGMLKASVDIAIQGEDITDVTIRQINVDGELWRDGALTIRTNKNVPLVASSSEEALAALREVLGEEL